MLIAQLDAPSASLFVGIIAALGTLTVTVVSGTVSYLVARYAARNSYQQKLHDKQIEEVTRLWPAFYAMHGEASAEAVTKIGCFDQDDYNEFDMHGIDGDLTLKTFETKFVEVIAPMQSNLFLPVAVRRAVTAYVSEMNQLATSVADSRQIEESYGLSEWVVERSWSILDKLVSTVQQELSIEMLTRLNRRNLRGFVIRDTLAAWRSSAITWNADRKEKKIAKQEEQERQRFLAKRKADRAAKARKLEQETPRQSIAEPQEEKHVQNKA
jgi:hypothetical protein